MLAAATILVSWIVTQVTFTQHYSHEYYVFERLSGRERTRISCFFQSDHWDFFYFAIFVWGCVTDFRRRYCFKVDHRRVATLHAMCHSSSIL